MHPYFKAVWLWPLSSYAKLVMLTLVGRHLNHESTYMEDLMLLCSLDRGTIERTLRSLRRDGYVENLTLNIVLAKFPSLEEATTVVTKKPTLVTVVRYFESRYEQYTQKEYKADQKDYTKMRTLCLKYSTQTVLQAIDNFFQTGTWKEHRETGIWHLFKYMSSTQTPLLSTTAKVTIYNKTRARARVLRL